MADKNKLAFGQLPLPNAVSEYTTAKLGWIGLNRSNALNTGELSAEKNMSTSEYPYLTPSKEVDIHPLCKIESGYKYSTKPLGIYGIDGKLVVLYVPSAGICKICADIYLEPDNDNGTVLTVTVADLGDNEDNKALYDELVKQEHCVAAFNQYIYGTTALDGNYVKKLIFLPLKRSMPFDIEEYSGSDIYSDKAADKNKTYYHAGNDTTIVYVGNGDGFTAMTSTGGSQLPALDVLVKTYYNDGYVLTNDDEPVEGKAYYIQSESNGTYTYSVAELPVTESKNSAGETVEEEYFKVDVDYYELNGVFTKTSDETANKYKSYYVIENNVYVPAALIDGSFVAGTTYYECSEDLTPPDSADTAAYYFNTYNSMTYKYVTEEEADKVEDTEYTAGWKNTAAPSFPDIRYCTVHQSRLFGVSDDMLYASGFNDYTNWNYDTMLDESANNAWYSTAQSNVKATGEFTGITTYENHVIAFKRDFMHEVYNTKNPFRIVDIGAIGTIDHRSIQEVGGKLIFVAEDNVKIYTGATPRNIGDNLGIDRFTYAVSGADDRFYYLYCKDGTGNDYLFVYDTKTGAWSELDVAKADENSEGNYIIDEIAGFANVNGNVYALNGTTGSLICITGVKEYAEDWNFETDIATGTTSGSTYKNIDIKHIRKIQFLATVGKGASFDVYGVYDHNTEGEKLYSYANTAGSEKIITVRIKPRKTAGYGYRLRIEGSGYVKIGEVEVHISKGGELFE